MSESSFADELQIHLDVADQDRVSEQSEQRELLRTCVADAAMPEYVSHLTRAVRDFSIYKAQPGEDVSQVWPLSRLKSYDLVATNLLFYFQDLDRRLTQAHRGRLFRVLLDSPNCSIFLHAVVQRQTLVAISSEQSHLSRDRIDFGDRKVRELKTSTDKALASSVDGLKVFAGEAPRSMGAWLTLSRHAPGHAEYDTIAPEEDSSSFASPFAEAGDPPPDWVLVAMRQAVVSASIHYLAFFMDGDPIYSIDRLADEQGEDIDVNNDGLGKRGYYSRLGSELSHFIAQMGRRARPVMRTTPHRVVLDMEFGAIFFYRISVDRYMIGVTHARDDVANADAAMMAIAESLSAGAHGE